MTPSTPLFAITPWTLAACFLIACAIALTAVLLTWCVEEDDALQEMEDGAVCRSLDDERGRR